MEGKCDKAEKDSAYSRAPDIIAKAKEAKAQGRRATGSFAMVVPTHNKFEEFFNDSEDECCNEDYTSCCSGSCTSEPSCG